LGRHELRDCHAGRSERHGLGGDMDIKRSESIAALAAALSKAQAVMEGAAKGSNNPHFKSKYADLSSVWEACRMPLTTNGLSVIQLPSSVGTVVTVTTILAHASGEWLEGSFSMTAQQDTPHAMMGCVTYCRRAGLASVAGIAPEDDDGNAASVPVKAAPKAQKPEGYDLWLDKLKAESMKGMVALKIAWQSSQEPFRTALDKATSDSLKAAAEKADKA
jgi:hypothetical protein